MKKNLLLILLLSTLGAHGQGTALTYQGRLNDVAGPASGKYEFQFTVRDALTDGNAVGVNPLVATLTVSNGLFTVALDPGAGVFTGADRWLEIAVRPTGEPLFTTLSPRQKITATPYAITAGTVTGNVTASQVTGTIPLAQLPPGLVTNGASGVNLSGTFTGNGAGLTGLNASQITGVLPSANLAGTYSGALTFNNAGNSFTGAGGGLTGLNASQLTGGTVPVAALGNAWKTTGNVGTTPGTHFLGTTDNQPLEFKVNGQRGLRIEPTAGAPNVIGGSSLNTVGAGAQAATIAGGFANVIGTNSSFSAIGGGRENNIAVNSDAATIAGGFGNNISNYSWRATIAGGVANRIGTNSHHGAIGGGWGNRIADNSENATIPGGYFNDIGTNSENSSIGGGYDNNIAANSDSATITGGIQNDIGTFSENSSIGGGYSNKIAANSSSAAIAGGAFNDLEMDSDYSVVGGGFENNIAAVSRYGTIAGGFVNEIGTFSDYCTIGGGNFNDIAANSRYATIPGGHANFATNYSFAAGNRAKANHTGSFVWGDSTAADIASATEDSVTIRADGGYRLYTHSALTAGVFLSFHGTAWSIISDRNVKKDFTPVDSREVLEKLAALPITRWHYQWEEAQATPHLGPMAQDFKAAFYPGRDDKTITTQETDGVALAAIQGLNQKLEAELKRRDAENLELKSRLERLEQLLSKSASH